VALGWECKAELVWQVKRRKWVSQMHLFTNKAMAA
jgi:hypothetical protein